MHKDFFTHIITHKPELFQAILRFNGVFPTSAPLLPETLRDMVGSKAPALWQSLLDTAPARRRLSLWQPDSFFWDFSEESRRLALVEADRLEQTIRCFGAALHGEDLARIIRKDELTLLRDHLGHQTLAYALERGRYQLGSLVDLFRPLHAHLPLQDRIALHGRLAFEQCLASWPKALKDVSMPRLAHLLASKAQGTEHNLDPTDLDRVGSDERLKANVRKIWFGFKKILLREVAAQWAPCFE